MGIFAKKIGEELGVSTPFGYSLAPIGSTSRYNIYKVGPVLIANVMHLKFSMYIGFSMSLTNSTFMCAYVTIARYGNAINVNPFA